MNNLVWDGWTGCCLVFGGRGDMMDLREVCVFCLVNSPKRQGVLDAVYKKLCPNGKKKSPLTKLCITRWQERIVAWRDFKESALIVVAAIEIIAGTRTIDKCKESKTHFWRKLYVIFVNYIYFILF